MAKSLKWIGVLLLVAALWLALSTYHFFEYGIDNAYAQWGAAEMVVHFMKKNDGRWPSEWEELRPFFEAGESRIGGWTFEKFQSRIWIDWKADPNTLEAEAKRSGSATFNVIGPADGIDVEWQGKNGNQILYEYFRSKHAKKQTIPRGRP